MTSSIVSIEISFHQLVHISEGSLTLALAGDRVRQQLALMDVDVSASTVVIHNALRNVNILTHEDLCVLRSHFPAETITTMFRAKRVLDSMLSATLDSFGLRVSCLYNAGGKHALCLKPAVAQKL